MTETDGPFSDRRWFVDAATIGTIKRGKIQATAQELAAAGKLLGLLGCRHLGLDFEIKPMSGPQPGNFRMFGQFRAEAVQACVVTLEPVDSKTDEALEIEFSPQDAAVEPLAEPEPVDPLTAADTGTYANGCIDLGQLAFELLSVSLDPYPRKPGAEFAGGLDVHKAELSPFAALAKLRKT